MKGIGIVIGFFVLTIGASAFLAFLLSWGLAFAFGVSLGFFKVGVGIFVVQIVSNIVFSGLRVRNSKEAK